MDDGSINTFGDDGSHIRLHTEGFSYDEHLVLQNILKIKFDINCNIAEYKKGNKKYNYLYLKKDDAALFQDLIKEYIHPSMDYKLLDEYKGYFDESLYFTYTDFKDISSRVISEIEYMGKETVYNIEVEDNNNYFVDAVLTHNCQNLTYDAFKAIITRIGTNSKYVFLGDVEQIDRKKKEESCLASILKTFEYEDYIGTIEFSDEDCVRNPIIPKILEKLREINV